MKVRNFFPLMVIAGSLSAQNAVDPQAPQGNPEKEPPKAVIIEEDEDVPEAVPEPVAGDSPEEAQPAGPVEGPPADDVETSVENPTPDDGALLVDDDAPIIKKKVNEGIQIQVEKFSSSPGVTDDSREVSVTSPWRAKPLDTPPLGWKYIPAPSGVDPYRTTVKLGGDRSVNLAITPYVLVPASDGRNVIRILEPGYQPDQDHRANDTIGSILQQSTAEIEDNEKRAAQAIQRLQRLLSSLPQP